MGDSSNYYGGYSSHADPYGSSACFPSATPPIASGSNCDPYSMNAADYAAMELVYGDGDSNMYPPPVPAHYHQQSHPQPDYSMDGTDAAPMAVIDPRSASVPDYTHAPGPGAGAGTNSGGGGASQLMDHQSSSEDKPAKPARSRNDKAEGEKKGGARAAAAAAAAAAASSEFTKRKNWSQRVIAEIQDFLHVLSPNGLFIFVSPSITDLCGYRAEELVGRSIVDFVHVDDREAYTRDFNASLHSKSEIALYTRFRKKDGRYIIFELTGHPHFAPPTNGGSSDEPVCKCVFSMGRPYPSKNAAMLDSFLDLKIENEKLRSKLEAMYKEIEAEGGLRSLGYGATVEGGGNGGNSVVIGAPGGWPAASVSLGDSPLAFNLGTGLVSSQGLYPSSGNVYGALGIGVSSSHRGSHAAETKQGAGTGAGAGAGAGTGAAAAGDKKKVKKAKLDDGEFVCRDCGTVDSPEWRKGPEGPKTLCNACGLRWAKKTKVPKAAASPKESRGADP